MANALSGKKILIVVPENKLACDLAVALANESATRIIIKSCVKDEMEGGLDALLKQRFDLIISAVDLPANKSRLEQFRAVENAGGQHARKASYIENFGGIRMVMHWLYEKPGSTERAIFLHREFMSSELKAHMESLPIKTDSFPCREHSGKWITDQILTLLKEESAESAISSVREAVTA